MNKEMADLKIEWVPTGELQEYEHNSKLHPHGQVDDIANSIEEFNFADPVAAWHDPEGNSILVEGHGRLLAAKKLGIEKLPVIYLDYLSDEQRRAYVHIHNKLNQNSGFDLEILDKELEELDFDWDDFGFDAFDIAEAATATDDFVPRSEEITAYSEKGEEELKSYNVVICCLDQEEQQFLSELLMEDGRLKRLYMCGEIMERANA